MRTVIRSRLACRVLWASWIAPLFASWALAGPPLVDLGLDVPTQLGGVTYVPNQIIRRNAGSYSTTLTLPGGTALSSLHRRSNGDWLFSTPVLTALGGVSFNPRDIAVFNGSVYSKLLDGAAAGIPAGAKIDALALDADGSPLLSFDAPVTLGGTTFGASDIVRYSGTFTLYWGGAAHSVPAGSNLVGFARPAANDLLLAFDVPTRLGAVDFLPGEVVRWQPAGYSSFSADAGWPVSSQLRDFALLPASGTIGNGPTDRLRVSKSGGANLLLDWGNSCAGTDTDYEVYEGTLAAPFTSHVPRACTTGGSTDLTLAPSSGARYYLVVPRNAFSEGSYGPKSDGSERPPASAACLPQSVGACS